MKRLFLLIFIISIASFAQQNRVKITGGDGDIYMAPLFSPDGAMVAFTGENYKGIWIYRFSDNSIQELTDETASGFGFSWSQDSKYILSRVAEYEGMNRLNAVKVFDVHSRESQNLSGYKSYMPTLPQWGYGDSKVFTYTKELEVYPTNRLAKNGASSKVAFIKNNKIAVGDIVSENMNSYNPFEGETIINLGLSPDGSKVTFEVLGGNMYVMNSDGTGLKDMGKGNRPKWSNDSKRIVFIVTEDDGHKINASDIYLINADGTGKKNLTNTDNKIEMNPSFTADDKNIVYDEATEGAIYIMKLD
jgi:Tol biopolymer transport system component